MSAVLRDTTIYSSVFVSKYLADARKHGGRIIALPFEITIQSAASAGDTYNLTVIPANARVIGLECVTDGIGGSAGYGATLKIGDAGDDDRYMVAADLDLTNANGNLAIAGAGYTPTADTIVVGTIGAAAAIVGKKVTGCLWVIPAA